MDWVFIYRSQKMIVIRHGSGLSLISTKSGFEEIEYQWHSSDYRTDTYVGFYAV